MSFTAPYRQHNYLGEHANTGSDAEVNAWLSGVGWPSLTNGMWYYDTTNDQFRVAQNSAWTSLSTGGVPTLASVLLAGNSAGATAIDMNSNKITGLAAGSAAGDALSYMQSGAKLDGLDLNSKKITNLLTPADPGDAANKSYVDSVAQGLEWQDSVLDRNLSAEPGGESVGDRYIIGDGTNSPQDVDTVNQGTKTFSIVGNYAASMANGDIIRISGSTGNDGWYTVVSSTWNDPNTDVVVSEAIPDATADGSLHWATTGDAWATDAGAGPGTIAECDGTGPTTWDYERPGTGFACFVDDEEVLIVYYDGTWKSFGSTIDHTTLSNLNSTNYYHLTQAHHTDLTDNGDCSIHHHDGRYYTEDELGSTTGGSEGASLIGTDAKANLGGATDVEAALDATNTHVGSTSNPHTVTLDQAYTAGQDITIDLAALHLTQASGAYSALHITQNCSDADAYSIYLDGSGHTNQRIIATRDGTIVLLGQVVGANTHSAVVAQGASGESYTVDAWLYAIKNSGTGNAIAHVDGDTGVEIGCDISRISEDGYIKIGTTCTDGRDITIGTKSKSGGGDSTTTVSIATGTGGLVWDSTLGLADINTKDVDWDASSTFNLTVTSADLTLATATSGDLYLEGVAGELYFRDSHYAGDGTYGPATRVPFADSVATDFTFACDSLVDAINKAYAAGGTPDTLQASYEQGNTINVDSGNGTVDIYNAIGDSTTPLTVRNLYTGGVGTASFGIEVDNDNPYGGAIYATNTAASGGGALTVANSNADGTAISLLGTSRTIVSSDSSTLTQKGDLTVMSYVSDNAQAGERTLQIVGYTVVDKDVRVYLLAKNAGAGSGVGYLQLEADGGVQIGVSSDTSLVSIGTGSTVARTINIGRTGSNNVAFNIYGGIASQMVVDSANLTIKTTTSGSLILELPNNNDSDLTFNAHGSGAIRFNSEAANETTLSSWFSSVTDGSIIGALNKLATDKPTVTKNGTTNPGGGAGTAGEVGDIYIDATHDVCYMKYGTLDTEWTAI
jgi:hypothetical protein